MVQKATSVICDIKGSPLRVKVYQFVLQRNHAIPFVHIFYLLTSTSVSMAVTCTLLRITSHRYKFHEMCPLVRFVFISCLTIAAIFINQEVEPLSDYKSVAHNSFVIEKKGIRHPFNVFARPEIHLHRLIKAFRSMHETIKTITRY